MRHLFPVFWSLESHIMRFKCSSFYDLYETPQPFTSALSNCAYFTHPSSLLKIRQAWLKPTSSLQLYYYDIGIANVLDNNSNRVKVGDRVR
jgi:hypothetical protein